MNKEVHIYLDNYSYILTTDKAYISMLTNEGTLQKVHYIIENGVTKIDFKALAEYVKINYVIREGNLLIDSVNQETIN